VFGYRNGCISQFNLHISSPDGHSGDNTGCQGHTHGVCRAEPFSLAPVICWSVGFNDGAALQVGAFAPQVAFINNRSSHLLIFKNYGLNILYAAVLPANVSSLNSR
jgi:hypothetical protein